MSRVGAALVVAWLAGCSCESDPVLPPTSVAPPAPATMVLPSAYRTDLPAAPAAIEITVRETSFEVSNGALVATWPEAERMAVGRTRPVGDATYPVVERVVDDASDALVVPPLGDAIAAVLEPERARAAIVPGEAVAAAFTVRADATVHYARVLAVVSAAGMAGLRQPRLVLASPAGERVLTLAPPADADDPHALRDALAHALGGGEIDVGPRALSGRTAITLTLEGLTFRRGLVALAPGCTEAAPADGASPTIAAAAITPGAIEACFDASGASGDVVFRAPGAAPYGDVVAILEALAAHHAVSLAAPIE